MKKRIDWIDVAKGISIILVIIGHSIKYNSDIYRFILSFHMPIFVILSGITHKIPKSKDKIKENIYKYIKQLLIPYILTFFIIMLLQTLTNDKLTLLSFAKNFFVTLIWGNGVKYTLLGHTLKSVGPLWFLITLFLSKIIFDLLSFKLKEKKLDMNIVIYCFCALAAIKIGNISWFPLNLDLVLIFLFYLYVGFLMKKYVNLLKKYNIIIFLISFALWGICLGLNINIELAYRLYPIGILSVIESLCASYCVIELCKIISQSKLLNKFLTNVGKISLIILCIHAVDMEGIHIWHLNINGYIFAIIRVIATLLVSFAFVFIKNKIKNLKIFKKRTA